MARVLFNYCNGVKNNAEMPKSRYIDYFDRGKTGGGNESLTTAALSIEAYALFGGCCIVASIEIPR